MSSSIANAGTTLRSDPAPSRSLLRCVQEALHCTLFFIRFFEIYWKDILDCFVVIVSFMNEWNDLINESFCLWIGSLSLLICFSDFNECDNSPCSPHANCTDTIGSYTCECKTGFTGNGHNCTGKCSNQEWKGSKSVLRSMTKILCSSLQACH